MNRRVARLVKQVVLLSALAVGASTVATSQAPDTPTLDFGQAAQWAPAPQRLPRDTDTQLMMIDVLDLDVPGLRAERVEPPQPVARGLWAQIWNVLAYPTRTPWATRSWEPALWLEPRGGGGGGGGQGVTRATRVHAYLTSLGTSTGEAFDIQIVNDGAAPVRIGGDGVVVEPVKKGSDKELRAELQQVSNRASGTATARANAYCLEFKLKPPVQGSMFHVADAPTQAKYTAAREILRASRRLQDAGALAPDSDPRDYFHAIRQWAIWANEQSFTLPSYRDAFVARTKKNAEVLGAKWSKQLEDGLKALVPHRWDEITKILQTAGQPVRGA